MVAGFVHRADTAVLHGTGSSWQPMAFHTRHCRHRTKRKAVGRAKHKVRLRCHGRHSTSAPHGAFTIAGSIGGLWPGHSAPLVLTVYNPQPFTIDVRSISTVVGTPKTGCTASNLTVAGFAGRLYVPAGGMAHLSVPVALIHAAPDACQGAVFPLTYSGFARKS
jgi:hypothetical protein